MRASLPTGRPGLLRVRSASPDRGSRLDEILVRLDAVRAGVAGG